MTALIRKARTLWPSPWGLLGDLIGALSLFLVGYAAFVVGHAIGGF